MATGGSRPRFQAQAVAVIVAFVLSVSSASVAFAAETPSPTPSVTAASTPTPDPTAEPTPTDAPSAASTPAPSQASAPATSATPTESASPTPAPSTPSPAPAPSAQSPTSPATVTATPTVHPWFQAKYAELGGASGPLGKPLKNMECQAASCWQEFEGGVLTSDGTQIVKLSTAYVATWLAWGGPDGDLGIVAGPESCFGTYCQTPFRGGVIVWVPNSGVFPVAKAWFYDAWMQRGGATGSLGLPTDGMKCQSTACYQVFQKGTLTSSTSGIVALSSAYVATWLANGGPDGALGLITGPETCDGKTCTVPFQHGALVWTPGAGVSTVIRKFSAAPAPTISGTAQTGRTLTAVTGTWSPTPDAFTYQWKRGTAAISGATAKTYVVQVADVGYVLSVTVTASKAGYPTTSKTSAEQPATAASFTTVPTPTVTGVPQVGSTLVGAPGKWMPQPERLNYRWTRDGTPISGATTASYVVTTADRGTQLRFTVTASRAGYTTVTETSDAQIVPGVFVIAPDPVVTGTVDVGATVTASTGTWTPAPTSFTYQWKRNGSAIPGATARTYTIAQTDAGANLSVTVTASRTNFESATRSSVPVDVPSIPLVRVTGDIESNTTWTPSSATVYVIAGPIAVKAGATLTIGSKASVKFEGAAGLTVYGTLAATGTTFTSIHDDTVGGDTDGATIAPQRGDWSGLLVRSGGTLSLNTVRVVYGASGVSSDEAASVAAVSSTVAGGIAVRRTHGAVTLTSNTLPDGDIEVFRPDGSPYAFNGTIRGNTVLNGRIDISSEATSGAYLTVSGNAITAPPGTFALKISDVYLRPSLLTGNTATGSARDAFRYSGTLTENWTVPTTGPRVVFGSLTVSSGATLTVPAGAVVKLGWAVGLTVQGSLVVKGTDSAPATLTSLYDDTVGGDTLADGDRTDPTRTPWQGIVVAAGGNLTLDHARVTYLTSGVTGMEASSISATSSTLEGGVTSRNARGPVTISSNAVAGGIRVERPEGYAYAFAVTITENTIQRGSISLDSKNTTAGALPVVVTGNTIGGISNGVFRITDTQLRPSNLTGNTATESQQFSLVYGGTLVEDWTLPASGPTPLFSSLTVAKGKTLTAPAGTRVRLEEDAELRVEGSFVSQGTVSNPVRFGSSDDGVPGQPIQRWKGITAVNGGNLYIDSIQLENDSAGITSSGGGVFRVASSTLMWYGLIDVSDATGAVTITGNTLRSVRVHRPDGPSYAVPVSVTGNTIDSGLTVESRNAGATAPPIVVSGNRLTAWRGSITFSVSDVQLRPSNLVGNSTLGGQVGIFRYDGTLVEDWTLPTTGPRVVFGTVTIGAGATLTAPAGTVVKFLARGGLTVRGTLASQGTDAGPVTLTSAYDDSVGGDLFGDGTQTSPETYPWTGMTVAAGGSVTGGDLVIKYATNGSNTSP